MTNDRIVELERIVALLGVQGDKLRRDFDLFVAKVQLHEKRQRDAAKEKVCRVIDETATV